MKSYEVINSWKADFSYTSSGKSSGVYEICKWQNYAKIKKIVLVVLTLINKQKKN